MAITTEEGARPMPRRLRSWFPERSRRALERQALTHAIEVNLALGRDFDPTAINRLVVNMLRHEYTDYDADQTLARHITANAAIKARYPWLGVECDRQSACRRAVEAYDAAMLASVRREEIEGRERREARSQASADAIKGLDVGTKVHGKVRGHDREGMITWKGRKRVEIEFALKSGPHRTVRLYASEVEEVA